MAQAARLSDYFMFMYLGELVEYGKTKDKATGKIFSDFNKASKLTLRQMDLLKKVVTNKDKKMPLSALQQLRKNEKKLDAFELKSAIVLLTLWYYMAP